MKKGIVVVCNLDTRGEDIVFVKDLIAGPRPRGDPARLQHGGAAAVRGRHPTEEVAARGGLAIEVVREKYRSDRDTATKNQIRGAAAIVDELLRRAACTA